MTLLPLVPDTPLARPSYAYDEWDTDSVEEAEALRCRESLDLSPSCDSPVPVLITPSRWRFHTPSPRPRAGA